MDLAKTITELQEERGHLNEAIEAMMRLAAGRGKRRGRPPAWLAALKPKRRGRPPKAQAEQPASKTRHRKGMSPTARKAQSERMKAYWAKRRKERAAS